MPATDLSRSATDFRKQYRNVVLQQGRVLTDDDFNEGERLHHEEERRLRVHVIGPIGSPDGGFAIAGPTVTAGVVDFEIGEGTLYVGGLRLELTATERYAMQSDWLQQGAGDAVPVPGAAERYDLVYVEAWEQPVSAVEDSELFEVALSGPDTSTRTRTMRRVRVREGVGTADCRAAWEELLADWTGQGTLDDANELVPEVSLKIDFAPGGDPADLCSPTVAGGYLGAENQAIRVELVDATHFTWGFDNASPLYRVQVSADSGGQRRVVTMLTEPRDQAHWPLAGQVVELLPWSAVLPNGEKIAERTGMLARVNGSYDPDARRFTLDIEVPGGFGEAWKSRSDAADLGTEYFYLRVWDRGADTASDAAIPFTPGTAAPLGFTGLEVTITGADRRAGDHWIIAARPESPDRVVPWQLEAGRTPHGYRRYVAPLALIRWPGGGSTAGEVVSDCRETFLPLTRLRTCCTYTVGNGTTSHGQFDSIQDAIDHLPPAGGQVCVLPGLHEANVHIEGRRNIILSGCGDRSRIRSAPVEAGGEAEPVVHIVDSESIRVESLALEADPGGAGVLVEESLPDPDGTSAPVREIVLASLGIEAAARSAIEVRGGTAIMVRGCRILMDDVAGPWPGIFVIAEDVRIEENSIRTKSAAAAGIAAPAAGGAGRGGLQLGGGCARVRVADNLIRGGIGNGITLGSLEEVDEAGNLVGAAPGSPVGASDPCNPCAPGDSSVPPDTGGEDGTTFRSAGPLHEIVIERNRILEMGLNGIGVVAFFDVDLDEDVISVEALDIRGNEIRGCLQRPLAEIDAAMIDKMGYGGIALADVDGLVIQHNEIVGNGPDHREPVCGIFVLHGEGIDIADNRILDNGAKTEQPSHTAKDGRRGGINIVLAIAPTAPMMIDDQAVPRQSGVPAARIHDNVVSQPLGQALSLTAYGPVSVLDNHFTSRGMLLRFNPISPSFLASTVMILNLGISAEFVGAATGFTGLKAGPSGLFGGAAVTGDAAVFGSAGGAANRLSSNGNVLFGHNQCHLDLTETGLGFAISSVAVFSMDDVGFHGNQCECALLDDYVLLDALLFGISVRASDNRLKEGLGRALYSALTAGLFNTTTNNQSTHCISVLGVAALKVDTGNRTLVGLFSENYCNALREGLGKTGFTLGALA